MIRIRKIIDKILFIPRLKKFLYWCTKEDIQSLFSGQGKIEDQFRLTFMAILLGYTDIACKIIAHMDEEALNQYVKVAPDEKQKQKLQWVEMFIDQQPDARRKKRLAKKILTSIRKKHSM